MNKTKTFVTPRSWSDIATGEQGGKSKIIHELGLADLDHAPVIFTGTRPEDRSNAVGLLTAFDTIPALPKLTPSERLSLAYVMQRTAEDYADEPNEAYFDTVTYFGEDPETVPPRPHQVLSVEGIITVREARIWPRSVKTYTFASLSRFTQGYIHALLSDFLFFQPGVPLIRFGQIHPRTFLRILADCAAAEARFDAAYGDYGEPETKGCVFWVDRLNDELEGDLGETFRPLTPAPDRKGRVIFELQLGQAS
jgi:hypothetical protein